MLGGYVWSARTAVQGIVELDVYLFVSASRTIDGHHVKMASEMPWRGVTTWDFEDGVEWRVRLPMPAYGSAFKVR